MVRKMTATAISRSVFIALVSSILLLSLLGVAVPQGVEYESDFTIKESYTIELTPTGDAHIVDELSYDEYYFEDYSSVFDEYPNLLSRRYRGDTDVGEIENFDVKVNDKKASVTITFDSPGFAYNMGTNWAIYGFSYEPSKTRDTEMVFEGEGTMNNEFTLFEDIPYTITTTVKFPEGATDPKFDTGDTAVTYVLPYEESGAGNLLQNNKSIFIPIFIVLMLLSLLLLLYVILNSRRAAAAEAAPSGFSPAPPPLPEPEATQTNNRRFCKKCGKALGEGDRAFCSNCGNPLE